MKFPATLSLAVGLFAAAGLVAAPAAAKPGKSGAECACKGCCQQVKADSWDKKHKDKKYKDKKHGKKHADRAGKSGKHDGHKKKARAKKDHGGKGHGDFHDSEAFRAAHFVAMLWKADRDHNMKVSYSELHAVSPEVARSHFVKLDHNRDAAICFEDLAAHHKSELHGKHGKDKHAYKDGHQKKAKHDKCEKGKCKHDACKKGKHKHEKAKHDKCEKGKCKHDACKKDKHKHEKAKHDKCKKGKCKHDACKKDKHKA